MENNELLTNEIKNEETVELVEIHEESVSGDGSGGKIGLTLLVIGALTSGGVALYKKNENKIKQHRINKLEKKLAKLRDEVTIQEEIEEEFKEVVETENDK